MQAWRHSPREDGAPRAERRWGSTGTSETKETGPARRAVHALAGAARAVSSNRTTERGGSRAG